MTPDQITRETAKAVHEIGQVAASTMIHRGAKAPDVAYMFAQMGMQTFLGIAPVIAKVERRAHLSEVTGEFAVEQMKKAMVPEVMTFAALYAVAIFDGIRLQDAPERDATGGVVEVSTDPEKLAMALAGWERLYPDKHAEDYLDEGILVAARNASVMLNTPIDLSHGGILFRGNGTVN